MGEIVTIKLSVRDANILWNILTADATDDLPPEIIATYDHLASKVKKAIEGRELNGL
ncbi:MAG: hypothetical protein ACTSPB_00520 [Candidatus Thorarchaeota archaeon]